MAAAAEPKHLTGTKRYREENEDSIVDLTLDSDDEDLIEGILYWFRFFGTEDQKYYF